MADGVGHEAAAAYRVLVVMGVSGVGKTTVGQALARRLGAAFADADDFHPPANVAKMASGTPLTDEDRVPWLEAIAAWIDARRAAGERAVVTCSALKRRYRAVIVGDRPDVGLVYLRGPRDLIAVRIGGRRNHFMPPTLLDSQLAALEPPGADERPITVDAGMTPRRIVDAVVARTGA